MEQVEKPSLNINAVYSFLTVGSVESVTTQTNPATGPCSFEQSFDLPEGRRYMCVAIIFGNLIKRYEGCGFSNGKCPFGKYTPITKIEAGKLEIENKWETINAKGR